MSTCWRLQVERIAHSAFKLARQRQNRLVSVDKSNVLEVSQLWREVVTRVGEQYPDVELSHMCARFCQIDKRSRGMLHAQTGKSPRLAYQQLPLATCRSSCRLCIALRVLHA